jgi:hypothetical protein
MLHKIHRYIGSKLAQRFHQRNLVAAIEKREIIGRHSLNIQIQTVSACNAACYFCPYQESWHKANPGKMTEERYNKIINELSQFRIGKFCPYLENEPLLDPLLFNRIEYAKSKLNFKLLEISTNASTLNKAKIDDIGYLFPKMKHEIWISFHGIDEQTFHSVMGLDFNECRKNVLSLIEKSQNHDLRIVIRGAGIARTRRTSYPEWFNKKEYFQFWESEFKKHRFKKIPEISFFTYHDRAGQIQRNEINFSRIVRSNLKGFYCHRFDQWAHFLYTGELILCCMDYKKKTVFGSIGDNSLKKIYSSDEFVNLIKKTTGMIPSPGDFICKKCISPLDGVYS